MDGAGVPVEFSKGEAGKGQHEINLVYADAVEMADRHVDLQERRQGDRVATRPRRSRSWRSTRWTRSARRATSTRACGTRRRRQPDVERRRARPPCRRRSAAGSAARSRRPRARVDVRPHRELLQALPARVVGADRARVGPRQPHLRLPGRRPRPGLPRRVAHPRRRREPVPRVRRDDRGRPRTASSTGSSRRPASSATRTPRPTLPHVPSTCLEAIDAVRELEGRDRGVRPRRAPPPAQHRRARSGRTFNRAVTDWERRRNFEQW